MATCGCLISPQLVHEHIKEITLVLCPPKAFKQILDPLHRTEGSLALELQVTVGPSVSYLSQALCFEDAEARDSLQFPQKDFSSEIVLKGSG